MVITILIILALLFSACSAENNIIIPKLNISLTENSELDGHAINLAEEGDEVIINIASNFNWLARSNAEWLKLSQNSGEGDGSITITADAAEKSRSAAVEVYLSDFNQIRASFDVIQNVEPKEEQPNDNKGDEGEDGKEDNPENNEDNGDDSGDDNEQKPEEGNGEDEGENNEGGDNAEGEGGENNENTEQNPEEDNKDDGEDNPDDDKEENKENNEDNDDNENSGENTDDNEDVDNPEDNTGNDNSDNTEDNTGNNDSEGNKENEENNENNDNEGNESENNGNEENGDTPEQTKGAYSKISKLSQLSAGEYYIGGYQDGTLHLATGGITGGHGNTTEYTFTDAGDLTPSAEVKAIVVTLEKAASNGYYIRFKEGYLTATAAGPGKLKFSETKSEYWIFSAHPEGGFMLRQSGDIDVQLIISPKAKNGSLLRSIAGDDEGNAIILFRKNI